MWTYAVRRLLLMIPTLFGISLINFGLINVAPAPRSSTVDEEGNVDESASVEAGEAERIFRQTFNLDKPVFLNARYGLEDGEILWRLATPLRAYSLPAEKVEDRDTLEDYGRTIVPHVLRIAKASAAAGGLDELRPDYERRWRAAREVWLRGDRPLTDLSWPPPEAPPEFDGAFRAQVLVKAFGRLRANAPRRARVRYGGVLSDEDAAYNREVRAEQIVIQGLYELGLGGEAERAQALEGWVAWYADHRGEWDYSWFDKGRMLFFETRFAKYWASLLSFDLGDSFLYRRPVSELILERLHVSITLSFGALILAYLIAIPLGILSAVTHRTMGDRVVSVALFAFYSFPVMFLGVLLRDYLGTDLGVFPVSGFESMDYREMTVVEQLGDRLHHLALPLLTLTLGSLAIYSRYMKSGLIEMVRADFVRTARAKGLSEFVVVMKHAVRNSLIPIVTLLGASLPLLIGGSVIVETIFGIDGMGRFGWQAVVRRDYSVLLGINILAAILTMVGVFLTDLLYALLDPRISYK